MTVLQLGGIDAAATLRPLTALPGDPTVLLSPVAFTRATLTPEGPGVIRARFGDGVAQIETAGDGGGWLAARAPGLLGLDDDVSGFAPTAPALRELWRRHGDRRILRTGTLWHDLAWFVVQQRIHRLDAAAQWRRLVTALGTPAPRLPGDEVDDGLLLPTTPAAIARLEYHDLHRFGIERKRAEHLITAARVVGRLERFVDGELESALPALRSVPGIGPWTLSCLASHTWGDADTVIVGDSGIPSLITWVLAREADGDDARMLELLEPYRPHRYRVIGLAFASGVTPPKRAPRGMRTDIRRR